MPPKPHQNILHAIGGTPMVPLARIGAGLPMPLLAKVEFLNPGGSIKDRMAMVKDVRIAKPSGSNVGFDEAAMEAAYQFRYKPAIQNGQPVAVWVTYQVNFLLKDAP